MSTKLNSFQKENYKTDRDGVNPSKIDCFVLNPSSVLCFYLRREMGRRTWIKIYSDKWLRGTIKNESLQTRGAFVSLLAMASDSPYENKGEIFITSDTGYTDEQFTKILNTSISQWKEIKQRLIDTQRISVDFNNIIHIINWTKYQSEYERQKQYREKLQPEVTKKVTSKKQETRNKNKNIKKDKNNKKRTFIEISTEFQLSKLLLDLILKRDPKYKKPDLQKWSKHIGYLIQIDGRKPERIKKVIKWCQGDDFWQNNILSTQKLRKQFNQLNLKLKKEEEYI